MQHPRRYVVHWQCGETSTVLAVSRPNAREVARSIYAGTLDRRGDILRVVPVNPTNAERRMMAAEGS